MTAEENKALIRQYFEVLNEGREGVEDAYLSPDIVCYYPGTPEPIRGLEANKEMEAHFRRAFSDIHYGLEDIIAEGDKVVIRRTWQMTHTGDFEGITATGRALQGTSLDLFRIEDGKVVESWTEFDNLSFMQQLGALPAHEFSEM